MKNIILIGDVLEKLKEIPDRHVNTVVTSPPYWGLRDYGVEGQLGLEKTPEEYVEKTVAIFREVRRVLWDDGTLWLNMGDSYAGGGRAGNNKEYMGKHRMFGKNGWAPGVFGLPQHVPAGMKPKDLVGTPWMVAFALRADGWYLRQDIIWHKPNPMPESVQDRCTKAHEYIFLLSKNRKYYYDADAIKEPASYLQPNSPESIKSPYGQGFTRKAKGNRKAFRGGGKYTNNQSFNNSTIGQNQHHGNEINESGTRNKRSVWTVSTKPFPGAHFATFPPDLIEPCILAGCPRDGIVLDPFFGSGTVGIVSLKNARHYIGIELNPEYAEMARNRIKYGTVDEEKIVYEKSHYELFEDLRIDNGGKA